MKNIKSITILLILQIFFASSALAIPRVHPHAHAKEFGGGKHDRIDIYGKSGDMIRHSRSDDTRYGGEKIIGSQHSPDGKVTGYTTVHGNDHVNKHGIHKK